MMKIPHYISKMKQRFGMINETNQYAKQILFNQRKYLLEQNILNSKVSGVTDTKYCNHNIIVSLTTFSKRLNDVHLAIESIMEQTLKANRIILWLDESYTNVRLPQAIKLLTERGLEIKYCKDLRSYKKLIPSLYTFPNDAIITIDDDLIYEFDVLEHLILNYINDQSYIYCCRQHKMLLDKNRKLFPYLKWELESSNTEPDIMNFPTGGAGTLYPPQSLDEEVFNEDIFLNICKFADDVWFKAMAMKKGTLSKKVYTHNSRGADYIEIENVQDIALKNINIQGEVLNDKQIHDVFTKYNLYKLLK